MYWLPYSSHTSHQPSQSSLNLLCHSKTDARFMKDGWKAVWRIPYVSVAFFPSLKRNFIAYCSSKVSWRPDCIFEIHQLWQSGFSRVYSNSLCSCSFEAEIIKIGQSSHKMYSNNLLNCQESTIILNACPKLSGNLLNAPRISKYLNRQHHWIKELVYVGAKLVRDKIGVYQRNTNINSKPGWKMRLESENVKEWVKKSTRICFEEKTKTK